MFKLQRLGDRSTSPGLSFFIENLAIEAPLRINAVLASFLEGLTSVPKFYAADERIVAALPMILWNSDDEARVLDVLIDSIVRSNPALTTAPTSIIPVADVDAFLKQHAQNLYAMALRAALARRCRGPRERAWEVGVAIALLCLELPAAQALCYVENILDRLERLRQQHLARHGLHACLSTLHTTAST